MYVTDDGQWRVAQVGYRSKPRQRWTVTKADEYDPSFRAETLRDCKRWLGCD
jgi:hypothetical protein